MLKYSYALNNADIEDIAADTFVIFYQNLLNGKFLFINNSGRWTYLKNIMGNVIYKYLKFKAFNRISLNTSMKNSGDEFINVLVVNDDPADTVKINDAVNTFFTELNKLPQKQAALFLIKLTFNIKTRDLAELLDAPVPRVSTYISNVKKRLFQTINHYNDLDSKKIAARIYDVAGNTIDTIKNSNIRGVLKLFIQQQMPLSEISNIRQIPLAQVQKYLSDGVAEIIKGGVKMRKKQKKYSGISATQFLNILKQRLNVKTTTLGVFLDDFCEQNNIDYDNLAAELDISALQLNKLFTDNLDVSDILLSGISNITGIQKETARFFLNTGKHRKNAENDAARHKYNSDFYINITKKIKKNLNVLS